VRLDPRFLFGCERYRHAFLYHKSPCVASENRLLFWNRISEQKRPILPVPKLLIFAPYRKTGLVCTEDARNALSALRSIGGPEATIYELLSFRMA
jgi:hypothetical protein